jgi:hypothetical protein
MIDSPGYVVSKLDGINQVWRNLLARATTRTAPLALRVTCRHSSALGGCPPYDGASSPRFGSKLPLCRLSSVASSSPKIDLIRIHASEMAAKVVFRLVHSAA